MQRYCFTIALCSTVLAFAFGAARAEDPASIQLVGTFNGITCEPSDASNNMEAQGNHAWRKLMFIDEPGDPDTILFKFTRDGSYFPEHWGWSGAWGVARLAWSPPGIATVLPDSGYYYFHFNDADYAYRLDRPGGSISGDVSTDGRSDLPAGTSVALLDAADNLIGTFSDFVGAAYRFDSLPPAVFTIAAHAPGYRDTTITGVALGPDEALVVPVHLSSLVGTAIASASCTRVAGGVRIGWCTMECGGETGFDVYRGFTPELAAMEKRNDAPIRSSRTYEFVDPCEDATKDLYYYLVEAGGDRPTRYGPLAVEGIPAPAAALGRNYPNPFNPSTTIPYTIGADGAGRPATISFFDVSGRMVDRRSLGSRPAGDYAFRWNPSAALRPDLPSGVYYCRLQIGKEIHTSTVILLR